jgi:hypothetical protein
MPDGKRKRRHSPDKSRRDWYARHRSARFQRRFGLVVASAPNAPLAE